MKAWIRIAIRKDIWTRGLKVSLVVGSLLVIINHWNTLFLGKLTFREGIEIVLTYFVPYGVSTYASVASIRKMEKESCRTSYE